MPVPPETLARLEVLRDQVGNEADDVVRILATRWVAEWDRLTPRLRTALIGVAALAVTLGRWPGVWELARDPKLAAAMVAVQDALSRLSARTGAETGAASDRAVQHTETAVPLILASQLPAAEQDDGAARFAAAVAAGGMAVVAAKYRKRATDLATAQQTDTYRAIRRSISQGAPLGDPQAMGATLLRRVETEFVGTGLGRAATLARTEVLDAHRDAAREVYSANVHLLEGWRWRCRRDLRVCVACVVMDGTAHLPAEPGPWGHQSCRCFAVPILKLGRPTPAGIDGKAWFDSLPADDQLAIFGPGRLALLRSGDVAWHEFVQLKRNAGWRPSYVPTPVYELRRIADLRRRNAA